MLVPVGDVTVYILLNLSPYSGRKHLGGASTSAYEALFW